MAFFLIVPSVMIVGVLLVHALAKRMGLKIYYSTLAAVALLSFVIIFAATFISSVPDKKFLAILGGLTLLTSLLLTFLNNFLIERQRAAEKNFTEEVKAAYAEELKKDSAKPSVEEIIAPIEKFQWENVPPEENKSDAEPAEKPLEDEPKEIVETPENRNLSEEFPLENVFKPLDNVKAEANAKALENEDAEPFEKPKPEDNFPLQEVFKPLEKISSESASKALETKDEPFEEPKLEENLQLQGTFKPLDKIKPEMLEKIQSETKSLVLQEDDEEFSLEQPLQDNKLPVTVEEISKTVQPLQDDKLPATVEEISDMEPPLQDDKLPVTVEEISKTEPPIQEETLDDLLDKAYDARGKGHIWQAIEHYRKALERYGTDEYAPFVAIDLGNLYKENALYAKAIKTYEDALDLPAVKRNDEIKREFTKNLEYLRIVRDILLKNNLTTTPFAKIPKEILQEIDVEFQKTQLRSAQYK